MQYLSFSIMTNIRRMLDRQNAWEKASSASNSFMKWSLLNLPSLIVVLPVQHPAHVSHHWSARVLQFYSPCWSALDSWLGGSSAQAMHVLLNHSFLQYIQLTISSALHAAANGNKTSRWLVWPSDCCPQNYLAAEHTGGRRAPDSEHGNRQDGQC